LGRIAGGDIRIPARQTATVALQVTGAGGQLLQQRVAYRAAVLIDLQNYGDVDPPVPPAAPPIRPSYYPTSIQLSSR
jgi:hypothetical protein